MSRPTAEREAELVLQWHGRLYDLIKSVEEERETRLQEERAALGLLTHLATLGARP